MTPSNARPRFPRAIALLPFTALWLVAAPRVNAGNQVVTPLPSSFTGLPGEPVRVDLIYSTSDPRNPAVSGLGLRIHFDSRRLVFANFANLLATSLFFQQSPQPDTNDFDGDLATDQFALVSWVDFNAAWPGSDPARLLTANFTIASGLQGSTTIRFTSSATAGGYGFASSPVTVSRDNARQVVLSKGRVLVTVDWRSQYNGSSGRAFVTPQKDEFAYFYFSDPNNPEVFIKVLDFGNGKAIAFVGGLSDFFYRVTFTSLSTGQTMTFEKPPGQLMGFADGDTLRFEESPNGGDLAIRFVPLGKTSATSLGEHIPFADSQDIALSKGRVTVTVDWRSQYSGASGRAFAIPQKDEFCYFYFSDPNNPEVFIKVLDFGSGTALLFAGGLSDFEYRVVFRNGRGESTEFFKAAGQLVGFADNRSLRF